MFHIIKDPPQWLLDGLLDEEKKTASKPCHDCGAPVNTPHKKGCDTARCGTCGGQRLSCGCLEGGEDVWTGLWPGVQEAYDQKLVCFDTATDQVCFDLNRAAIARIKAKIQKDNSNG